MQVLLEERKGFTKVKKKQERDVLREWKLLAKMLLQNRILDPPRSYDFSVLLNFFLIK